MGIGGRRGGGASGAQAFTIQTLNNSNSDGSTRFADPDEQAPIQHFSNPTTGQQGYKSSIPGFSFSIGTEQQNPGSSLLFDPSRNPHASPFGSSFGFGADPLGRTR